MKIKKAYKKSGAAQKVLEKVSSLRVLQGENSLRFPKGFEEYEVWLDALETMVEERQLSPNRKREIIDEACRQVQDLSLDGFLADVCRIKNIYLSRRMSPYRVVYPILGPANVFPRRKKVGEETISFNLRRSTRATSRIIREREELGATSVHFETFGADLEVATICSVAVKARNVDEAEFVADKRIRFYLGLLSFVTLYRQGRPMLPIVPFDTPLCSHALAPFITVHEPDGRLADGGTYWYTEIKPLQKYRGFTQDVIPKIRKNERRIQEWLRKSPMRVLLERCLSDYHEALSEPSYVNAFLKLWILLERLMNVERGDAEIAIKRLGSLYPDNSDAVLLTRHLLHRRNAVVHDSPVRRNESYRTIDLVRTHIETVFVNIASNQEGFTSLNEFWEMADNMRAGAQACKKRLRILKNAVVRLDKLATP
ncbi:MAG: hypothetical protein AAGG09_13505 [Pseudomonadota bacterium]